MPGAASGGGIVPLGIQGPTPDQSAYLARAGDTGGQIQADLAQESKNLPSTLARQDILINALRDFQAGSGAGVGRRVAQLVQGLQRAGVPLPDSLISEADKGQLSAQQLFDSVMSSQALRSLGQDAKGSFRVPEIEAAYKSASSSNDPEMLLKYLNLSRQQTAITYDQAQKFPQFRQALGRGDPDVKGMNLADYYTWYNDKYSPAGLPNTNSAGGMQLAPIGPEGIKGVKSAEPTFATKEDLVKAYRSGQLTREQAAALAKSKGWAQ
jgi:hypothetical protein